MTDVHTTCILIMGAQPISLVDVSWMSMRFVLQSCPIQRTSSLPRKLARALATPENVQCIFFGVATALKCPAESAARLRVSEKQFVLDHAVLLVQPFGCGSCLDYIVLAWPSMKTFANIAYNKYSIPSALGSLKKQRLNILIMTSARLS